MPRNSVTRRLQGTVPKRGAMSPITGASFGKGTAARLPRLGVTGQQMASTGAMGSIGRQAVMRRNLTGGMRPVSVPRIGVRGSQMTSMKGIRSIGAKAPSGRFARLASMGRGKKALIGAGILGAGAIANNTGRATDKTRGRPTGMFKY